MASLIDDLKHRARLRQRAAGDAPEKRRECLAELARELGFDGWPHLVAVLHGERVSSYGTLLYPRGGAAHANIWSASYDEARSIRAEHGGYLLAYKKQFFVVEGGFIETMGLDPADPDWDRIGRDWVSPADPAARSRLCEKLIRHRLS